MEKGGSISDMFLKDLEEFEDEIEQEEEAVKLEEEDQQASKELFRDYESRDLISQEKEKLLGNELYKKVVSWLELEGAGTRVTEADTFQIVVECNQQISRIDQL
jgi:Mg2+ and Co2+ transporter CorA